MSDDTTIEFHPVAKTGDLDDEEVMAVFVDGREIALYNVGGEFYATDGVCTHENVGLADGFVDGDIIECPLHGGKFEIKTGKPANPPVTVGLQTYPVRIEGDSVLVGVAAKK